MRKLRTAARISFDTVVGTFNRSGNSSLRRSLTTRPLFIAEKTYNTAHPDYDPDIVRNYSNCILGADRPCTNALFLEIAKLAKRGRVPKRAWQNIYSQVTQEARTVPGFEQVMERKAYIEQYTGRPGAGMARGMSPAGSTSSTLSSSIGRCGA